MTILVVGRAAHDVYPSSRNLLLNLELKHDGYIGVYLNIYALVALELQAY